MNPFLSIIIPVYKIPEKYLRACLESLISQDRNDFKAIIVDDGSPDNCGAICDEYARRSNRFYVIHQENQGVSVARNAGIEIADTEYIAFIDPDDWVESNFVSMLYQVQENNDADIYFYDYYQEFADRKVEKHLAKTDGKLGTECVYRLKLSMFNQLFVDGKPYKYEINTIWNKMYKTSLVKDNKILFDPKARKGQDAIFNAEILQLTNEYYYMNEALYHYRYLQESVTNRFNTNVVYYNEIAFYHYERIIKKYNLPSEYWSAYYAKVVTRHYSYMRLYFFHPSNKNNKKETKNDILEVLHKEPYRTALHKVSMKELSKEQKLFVLFLKLRCFTMLRVLVMGRQWLKNISGKKLR